MLDVGCGVGGSSRHIARKWGLERAKGVSLSPFQIGRAKEFTAAQVNRPPCLYHSYMNPANMTTIMIIPSTLYLCCVCSYTCVQGLSGTCEYAVEDAMKMSTASTTTSDSGMAPLSSSSSSSLYDLGWSMESGEHMPDKKQFVHELAAATAPGGRVIVVTWCHRELTPERPLLSSEEQRLLARICDAYYLPAWAPASEYVTAMTNEGLQVRRRITSA